MKRTKQCFKSPLTGKRDASALLFVLVLAALLTIIVAALLIIVDNKVEKQHAYIETLQTRMLSKGAETLALSMLPESLPEIGEEVAFVNECLPSGAVLTASLARLSEERVEIKTETIADKNKLAHKQRIEAVAFSTKVQLSDTIPPQIYILETGKNINTIWQHVNKNHSKVLIARSDDSILLSEGVPAYGLHCHGKKTIITKETVISGDAIFDGEVQLEAPLSAKTVWLDGVLTFGADGALQAETIHTSHAIPEDDLEKCSGNILVDLTQKPKMCYYFLE